MIVTGTDTASAYGSGLVDVFATPAMIALMERTAQESVQGFLPEGYITVGTEVSIRHLKATPIGVKVICNSVLIEAEGSRLTFDVAVTDDGGKAGEGTHVRFIVEKERFMRKLSNRTK
ncbi:MAG: thioesterase family protein [Bacteroidales bacterium]|nr:thioesterase family protein [Bacteroidales bacterium]